MKRFWSFILMAVCTFAAAALPELSPQQKYVEKYAALAVEEMYRNGVPASITLAQGLLESRYGLSELATKGNNHFGIKCHNNWNGGRMYHDDDERGECFRVYKSPEESFKDHSDFLRYRDRYKFLFDLEPTDYKGWAHGLRKAGYATDPAYPQKLIKLIEDYKLYQYDSKTADWAYTEEPKLKEDAKESKKEAKERNKKSKKAASNKRPESPIKIEQPKPLSNEQKEVFHLSLSREMYSLNGVPFVRSTAGESYASIASRYNLFFKEILKYNDLQVEQTLYPGTVVYLQPKKKQAAKGLDMHIVEGNNERLRDIAQRYGVRMNNLCKINGISPDKVLYEGEIIKLRK